MNKNSPIGGRGGWAFGLLAVAATAAQPASATDFGIRTVGMTSTSPASADPTPAGPTPAAAAMRTGGGGPINLLAVSDIGAHWGRVTSTLRSVVHNRAVGGVPNSWHLKGRAIDIARRPGVTHAMIAAAFRAAGYHLMESLDEGDHSHFAFGGVGIGGRPMTAHAAQQIVSEATRWGMVLAPGFHGH